LRDPHDKRRGQEGGTDPLANAGTGSAEFPNAPELRPMDLATEEGESLESAASPAIARPRSLWGDALHDLRRNPVFVIAVLLILFLVFIALWPGVVAGGSPYDCDLGKANQGSTAGHPFGFDSQGCDVFNRTIHGARASVTVGICATLGAALLGTVLGGMAGFFGGWWDAILSRVTEVFFGIPILLGGLVFLSVITSGSVWPVIGLIVLLGWPQVARIARGSVMTAKQNDYVQAARSLGAGNGRMLLRHVLPNAVAPIIVVATIALGTYIALEATLSFLGVGLKPPTVSWGQDISTASPRVRNAPHALLWPAGALSLTVLAFIMLGDAVRDALDPKLR
jgi:oligopeptide transport system permease protein